MAGNPQSVGLNELLELAISSQDVGTVNFNILRLLLDDMIKKLAKIDQEPVKLGDHDANQVANYKNYIQGAPVSPMPGVMRYTPSGSNKAQPPAIPGPDKQSTPRTPKSGKPPVAAAVPGATPIPGDNVAPGRGSIDAGPLKEMQDKIAKLEKQLQANQTPNNQDAPQRGKDKDGMSVNDMWQLIQLNNRIAAAEAGLQKMASLIEDLAKQLNNLRGDTTSNREETNNLAKSNSDLSTQVAPLSNKHDAAAKKIDSLEEEIGKVKSKLELLETATGVDTDKSPSFMKKKKKDGKGKPGDKKKVDPDTDPTNLSSMSPSEIAHISPSEVGNFTPKQIAGLSAEQLAKMTPSQMAKLDPVKIASMSPSQIAQITPKQMKDMTPEQRQEVDKLKTQAHTSKSPDLNKMSPEEIAKLTPSQINTLTPEKIAQIHPSKIAQMNPSQIKHLEKVKKDKSKGPDVNKISDEDISKIPVSELAKLTPDEASKIPASKLEAMTPDQKKEIEKIKRDSQHGPDLNTMSPEELSQVPLSELNKLSPTQIANITPSQLTQMTPDQVKKIEDLKSKPPPDTKLEGTKPKEISLEQIGKLSPSQAASLSPSVVAGMTKEQKNLLEERINSVKPKAEDLKNMHPDDIALVPIEDLSKLSASEVDKINPSVLALMTPEQLKKLDEIKNGPFKLPDLGKMTPKEIAEISMSTINKFTPSQIESLTDEVKAQMTPEQLKKLDEILVAGKNYGDSKHGEGFKDPVPDATKKRKKDAPKRLRGKKGQTPGTETDEQPTPAVDEDVLDKEEELEVPKPALGEHKEVLTMESYLKSLPKEDLDNMAADAVEQELQKQYEALQGMQRKLAQDIQDKMEIIYQKLLKDIIAQNLTTSPYTVMDGAEKCLGPGICKGHGMPAGIAVCQYSDLNEKHKPEKPVGGAAACPECGNEALKKLKPPRQGKSEMEHTTVPKQQRSDAPLDANLDQQTGKDAQSISALDLDKMRDDIKSSDIGIFDEKDIMERLGTVWEAVKVLKANEDALTARLTKHETLLKKLPAKAMEKMNKSGIVEYSESLAPSQLKDQLLGTVAGTVAASLAAVPSSVPYPKDSYIEADQEQNEEGGGDGDDKDDIQTLFNNLANVIAECADQKDRIDQLVDAVRIIESGMVTKQTLTDSMSDKADKGQINTKVSYDEFGNTVDELHTQLHNLMVEGYQRNENWKKVTADLAEELAEKLDKVELAPIRAFFKSRLKNLEDRMHTLSTLLEEPDPAGTRKKLLRDYNCISCDRRVNISGVTNTPMLPTIGPSMAMSTQASHRALDLHRLRSQRSRMDSESREIAALDKQVQSQTRGSSIEKNEKQLSDKDMMQVVNRYVGSNAGSHSSGPLPAMRVSQAPSQLAAASTNVQASQSKRTSLTNIQATSEIVMDE